MILKNYKKFVGLFAFFKLIIFIAKSPTKNKLFLLFKFFVGLFVFYNIIIFIAKSPTNFIYFCRTFCNKYFNNKNTKSPTKNKLFLTTTNY
jgi:hypothetical protein